jgi:hypothetical protein
MEVCRRNFGHDFSNYVQRRAAIMTSLPWMKFYPADWRSDPALRMCSLAARGLWMEMLAVMHESSPRGLLLINGKSISNLQLASLCGTSVDEVTPLLSELENSGVFSRKKNDVIFSRRMEKDENKSRKNKENGKLGGNPNLCNIEEKLVPVNREVKAKKPEARDQNPESDKKDISGGAESLDDLQVAASAWNDLAAELNFPKVQSLTEQRKSALVKRFKEIGGLSGWESMLEIIKQSPHLLGQNEHQWKVTFDWVLIPKNLTKIMEGNYVRTGNHQQKPQRSFTDEVFAALQPDDDQGPEPFGR